MVGWHYRLNGRELEQAPKVGDGQGSLACCSPWGRKESYTAEQLNWTDILWMREAPTCCHFLAPCFLSCALPLVYGHNDDHFTNKGTHCLTSCWLLFLLPAASVIERFRRCSVSQSRLPQTHLLCHEPSRIWQPTVCASWHLLVHESIEDV